MEFFRMELICFKLINLKGLEKVIFFFKFSMFIIILRLY